MLILCVMCALSSHVQYNAAVQDNGGDDEYITQLGSSSDFFRHECRHVQLSVVSLTLGQLCFGAEDRHYVRLQHVVQSRVENVL